MKNTREDYFIVQTQRLSLSTGIILMTKWAARFLYFMRSIEAAHNSWFSQHFAIEWISHAEHPVNVKECRI